MIISYSLNSVLENYAKWQLVLPYLSLLDSSFRTASFAFRRVTGGDGEKDRYKLCVSLVQEVMPTALALPYTNVLIPKETKVCNVANLFSPACNGYREECCSCTLSRVTLIHIMYCGIVTYSVRTYR